MLGVQKLMQNLCVRRKETFVSKRENRLSLASFGESTCPLACFLFKQGRIHGEFRSNVCHQRIVRIGLRHQQTDGLEHQRQIQVRFPRALWRHFQQIQAYSTAIVDVRVVYFRHEKNWKYYKFSNQRRKDLIS